MIILISGATHTGKTALAQKLLQKYGYPYLSIDHLKMGLIRSGVTDLTPEDDSELTEYLWPIIKEIVKTAIENKQNLIIEGCYIPFDWKNDFSEDYLLNIRYICLVMTEEYIKKHYNDIIKNSSVIEKRICSSDIPITYLIKENRKYLEGCTAHGCNYLLITDNYTVDYDI